jgi:hypothetical protein
MGQGRSAIREEEDNANHRVVELNTWAAQVRQMLRPILNDDLARMIASTARVQQLAAWHLRERTRAALNYHRVLRMAERRLLMYPLGVPDDQLYEHPDPVRRRRIRRLWDLEVRSELQRVRAEASLGVYDHHLRA